MVDDDGSHLHRYCALLPHRNTIMRSLVAIWVFSYSHAFVPRSALLRPTSFARRATDPCLEQQASDLRQVMEEIEDIRSSIRESNDTQLLATLEGQSRELEQQVQASLKQLVPPEGLLLSDYIAAIRLYVNLPYRVRVAFCDVLDLDRKTATEWDMAPVVVSLLYEQRESLTAMDYRRALERLEKLQLKAVGSETVSDKSSEKKQDIGSSIFGDKAASIPLTQEEASIQNLLGRVTRKDDRVATESDALKLMSLLGSDVFVVNGKPEQIPGGFIVRGQNRKASANELIEAIDRMAPSQWSCQVCFVPEMKMDTVETFGASRDPVLLLLNRDMSPTASRWLLSLASISAVVTSLLFSIGIFGSNDLVTDRLNEQAFDGDFSGFNAFNLQVLEVVLPIFGIQAVHDLSQFLASSRSGIKTETPTLLPFWGLPFLGSLTQLKEPPKTLTALYDFAIVGPLSGLITSVSLLAFGAYATVTADAAAAQLFPALPVGLINSSTLGSSILDAIFGGNGVVTLQDPKSAVSLHPMAIAGFCGVLTNSLDLLPLGSTNGGRISLALFGRKGHSVVGGFIWLSLLLGTLFLERPDIILGAWLVYNLTQNDPEIPCRNEVDSIDAFRAVTAFALWFVAALAIIPLK